MGSFHPVYITALFFYKSVFERVVLIVLIVLIVFKLKQTSSERGRSLKRELKKRLHRYHASHSAPRMNASFAAQNPSQKENIILYIIRPVHGL